MAKLDRKHIKQVTPYRDINEVLDFLVEGVKGIFDADLIGIYLTGSLSYGDFEEGRSDIDLAVVLKKAMAPEKVDAVKKLYSEVDQEHEKWGKRMECSYIPQEMLTNILPPKESRLYVGNDRFCTAERYGNEWLINKYLLYKDGISLVGPEFATLVEPVRITDVQKACIKDLEEEWMPKISNPEYLANPHYQSYLVLNVCRILYTVIRGKAGTKKAAAAWVKKEYPQWKNLVETAESWHYGVKMERQPETIAFVRFATSEIDKSSG